MTNGYIIIVRNRQNSHIIVNTIETIEDYLEETDYRIIYCQAVSDLEIVTEKVSNWLEETTEFVDNDINECIASTIMSLQWIANDHTLKSFTLPKNK